MIQALKNIPRNRGGLIGIALAAMLLFVAALGANTVKEDSLKAAFLYNFLKYTTWPEGVHPPKDGTFKIGVVNDDVMFAVIKKVLGGKRVQGRRIVVQAIKVDEVAKLKSCHELWLGNLSQAETKTVVESIGDAPILTVSDSTFFCNLNGMIQMYKENGKIRFEIFVTQAKKCGLSLSAKILTLARVRK